ncbi:MAG: hypothetical protein ACRDT6_02045 [Micromonosporaceae bacterium]
MIENYFHHDLHHARAAELRAVAERHRLARQVRHDSKSAAGLSGFACRVLCRWRAFGIWRVMSPSGWKASSPPGETSRP